MMEYSVLYPIATETRTRISLDGYWYFRFDPVSVGGEERWAETGLPDPILMPVPGSFADLFTEPETRDYCGDFWYETTFYAPECGDARELYLRFGSISHRATVYVNGREVGSNEGGFLPVVCRITDAVRQGAENRLTVRANNELSEATLPCGAVATLSDGRKIAKPYFDFFHYAGIQRSVYLLSLPKEQILDFDITYELCGDDAKVHYTVRSNGSSPVFVKLTDADGHTVAEGEGCESTLTVQQAKLWDLGAPYLYTFSAELRDHDVTVDRYFMPIGIRTFAVRGAELLLNGKPVYLKGYGKHEDFDVIGRSFNASVAMRDMECMKWSHANCFRTSHYPYAEEWYQLADRYGFLIIDEVAAVGMMRSVANFLDAAGGKNSSFFESDTIEELKREHLRQIRELIARDKHHPSVIAWSLFNEPETTGEAARRYFQDIFDASRDIDPERRPLTGALMMASRPENCRCWDLLDFICLNRYYGWYALGGPEFAEAKTACIRELEAWKAKGISVPIVFTEFGADTLASEHKLPAVMWSQEYQCDYYRMMGEVFDQYDFVRGELAWNFADFQTTEGIMRVNGNKKGVFTRNRQPKDAAFVLRERWANR